MRSVPAIQLRSKALGGIGAIVQLYEPQVQLSCRGVGLRPRKRPPRHPNDGGRQRQGEVKTSGHWRRAQQGNLDAFGVERGVGRPRRNGSGHVVFDMVLRWR